MIEVASIRVVVTDKDKKKVQLELTLEDAQQLYLQLGKLFAASPSYVPVLVNPALYPQREPVKITYAAGTPSNTGPFGRKLTQVLG